MVEVALVSAAIIVLTLKQPYATAVRTNGLNAPMWGPVTLLLCIGVSSSRAHRVRRQTCQRWEWRDATGGGCQELAQCETSKSAREFVVTAAEFDSDLMVSAPTQRPSILWMPSPSALVF